VALLDGLTERLLAALDALSAPHIPSPEEAAHLDSALQSLIAAYSLRGFEPGEEAVWNCHGASCAEGTWEIKLRRTDCDSGIDDTTE
jgi:hypothetical protein